MEAGIKAVLLDLDGTLVDHFRVIYRCYVYALRKMGLEPVSYERVRSSVGGSIVVTFGKLVPPQYVDAGVHHFREEFDRIWHEEVDVLAGVPWLLEKLGERGVQRVVFTNKEGGRARKLLDHVGLMDALEAVYGTLDTPWRKPQPEFTRHVLTEIGVEPEAAVMIGDSPYDADAAATVGMRCYLVATGSHSEAQLAAQTQVGGIYADMYALGAAVFGMSIPARD